MWIHIKNVWWNGVSRFCHGLRWFFNLNYVQHTWSDQYLIYCNNLYTLRSGIQIPIIWYIAVADQFTRTEITYIQVTLPHYLKQRDVANNIFRVPVYNSGLHPYIFNVNIWFRVQYIPGLKKSLVSLRCEGEGCMLAICSPSPIMRSNNHHTLYWPSDGVMLANATDSWTTDSGTTLKQHWLWIIAVLMLGQSHWRWDNTKTTLL